MEQQAMPHFLIITGMSGAGKTQVLRTLEDLNFFCVDNLPPALMPKFAELCRQTPARDTALVVDTRGGIFFDKLVEVLDEMKSMGTKYEVLFLDASDPVLIRRYKETRRRHPMEGGHNLATSVAMERKYLTSVRERATQILDTSFLSTSELKEKIHQLYGNNSEDEQMLIVVQSFGFKHGIPLDSDIVLDVRFLPNPFYEEDLRHLTGNDQPVADFIGRFDQTYEFLKRAFGLLDYLVPQYIHEGKSQLVISIGCTGGQHRSIFIANKIYDHLRTKGNKVEVTHRDIDKKK
jgi:UPF0042 nucleotide-binding protein